MELRSCSWENWSGDEVDVMVDSCVGVERRFYWCGNLGFELELEQGISECQCLVLSLDFSQYMV